jgi:hypothetical protein
VQVAASNTPATPGQILGALIDGGAPRSAAPLLLAQSAFETGGWSRGFWGYNLGNITTSGASGDFQMLPGDTTHRYKVYDSLTAGAADYVNFLNTRGLVAVAATGSLSAYVARLKQVNYAEALATPTGYAQYQAGMAMWLQRLQYVVPESSGLFAGLTVGKVRSYAVAGAIVAGSVWATRGIRRGRLL